MIVVAVIGTLAAIAIPNFVRYQLRSKAGEALTQIASIAMVEQIYFTENGTYAHVAVPSPPGVPGSARALWPGNADFDRLGWRPEGPVYFQYLVSADGLARGRFTIEAAGDIDSDGIVSYFGYVHSSGGAGIAGRLPGTSCAGSGVFDHVTHTSTARDVPGPCDAASGRQSF